MTVIHWWIDKIASSTLQRSGPCARSRRSDHQGTILPHVVVCALSPPYHNNSPSVLVVLNAATAPKSGCIENRCVSVISLAPASMREQPETTRELEIRETIDAFAYLEICSAAEIRAEKKILKESKSFPKMASDCF